jgi:PAS domain S-box-containing protein
MNRFNQYARAAGAAGILIGALVLLGWALDISLLKSAFPGKVAMRPNTAICFLLTGASLLLLVLAPAQNVVSATRRRAAVVFTTLTAAIALAAMSEYLFRTDWGVDRLLVRNLVAADDSGRMAAGAALGFILLAGSLLLLDAKHRIGRLCSELLALATLLLGMIALLGYVYEIESLYGLFAYTPIAVHTSFLLVVFGLGVLFSRPESGLTSAITSERGGGVMARRVLPVTVLLLAALAWFHLRGGMVLFVAIGVTALVVWVWLIARSLNLLDEKREQVVEALKLSEERLRLALDAAHLGTFDWDVPHNRITWSRWHEEMWGIKPGEFAGTYEAFSERVHADDLPEINAEIARCIAARERFVREFRIVWPDGSVHWIASKGEFEFSADGQPGRMRGAVMDITERKRAEADVMRLAAAVEQTADSVVITDPEGAIQYVNPAFERITGYSEEEVLSRNPRILKSGKTDRSVYKELWETITRGEVWVGQLTNRKKDGTLFEERVTISPVLDKAGRIVNYIAVKQDTSDLVKLEEQLRQSQKMEAIGQLAGGVAHDFNNLLTAINGYSALALQRIDETNPLKGYLEEIKKAGDRAANLTRQLLAFGRKQILQPLPVNLNDIVTDMNKMLRRLIGEDIVLTAKLDPALKRIKADPGQIEQVLVNLVVNARDAMPQGGDLTIETSSLELDQEYASKHVGVSPGHYVLLAVSDTGTGMSEETQDRIFDPFFTTKEKGKGTGLGLSTVYGIVKQSGGNIWVYSEEGHGTTFKVYLPQIESASRTTESEAVEDPIPSGSETILLVEDEDVVRGVARQILEQAGYQVVEARGGEEAVRLCTERSQIDLLLTDVVMPGTSGKEVADRATELRPGLKVLFMSGYTDEAIVHHGILDSHVEFIQKPFTPIAFAKKVREVLDLTGRGNGENELLHSS